MGLLNTLNKLEESGIRTEVVPDTIDTTPHITYHIEEEEKPRKNN